MRLIDAEQLQDGLYNIKDGKIYKYKAKGGTVRTYELRNIVTCGECRYWHKNRKDGDDIPVHDACYDFTADDFCSYGVRIDEYEKEYRELGLGKLKALRQMERSE